MMFSPDSRFPKPDQWPRLLAACFALSAFSEAFPLTVGGSGSSGLHFEGELAGLAGGVLMVDPLDGDPSLQIGVPVSSLESLTIRLPAALDTSVTRDLETLLPVLAKFERESVASLLGYLELRGAAGQWTDVYLWTRKLGNVPLDTDLLQKTRLLKARSLHALGLYRRLGEELAVLEESIPPIAAPPVYCWLQAVRLARQEAWSDARFWARLPFLTIPVPRDPLMDTLAGLSADLTRRLEPTSLLQP